MQHVHERKERFIAGVTCRQVGKTVTAGIEVDEGMNAPVDEHGPPWVGLIAPTYNHCDLVVNRYVEYLAQTFGAETFRLNQNKHVLQIVDPRAGTVGARFQWVSGDDPLYSMGFTFSKLLADESQRISDAVYYKIRPTLSVREAQLIAFGTPDITPEQSWYRNLWTLGQDPDEHNIHSYGISCFENPHMSLEEIEEARRTLSWREFRMLYLAEWASDDEIVFGSIDNALLAKVPDFRPKNRHVMSVDFAIHEDFNAILIGEAGTRSVIHRERWNQTPPMETYDRIYNIWERFGRPNVVADETGIGEPMVAELRARGMRVRGIKFTAANKMPMIGRLAADIEHRRIMFPAQYEDLIRELKSFVFQQTPSGKLTAAAAAGYHDDLVMSLILLNEGMSKGGGSRERKDMSYITSDSMMPRMGAAYASYR
jgi:hypothetical protein